MVNGRLVLCVNPVQNENVPSQPSPEQAPMAPNDPPFSPPSSLRPLELRQEVAIAIALQTHVLKTCSEHNEIFCDEEADPAAAFSLAVDLVKHCAAFVRAFDGRAHALTDLLTIVISAAPTNCPHCCGFVDTARMCEYIPSGALTRGREVSLASS